MMNSKKSNMKNIKTIEYSNHNVGFSLTIPSTWLEVKKTSFSDLGINDNTLFVFTTDEFSTLTAVFSGFCKKKSFNKFFEKIKLSKDFNVVKTGLKEYKNVSVKFLIIEKDNLKVMHNFCLINDMIVNFTINLNPNTKINETKSLNSDTNIKLVNEVLKTMEVFEPINPPIYINDERYCIKEEGCENIKSIAQIYVENDCKYKNITLPNFFLKYIYLNQESGELLSIINKEIYYKSKDTRVVKVNEDLSNSIAKVVEENMTFLKEISVNEEKTKLNSSLVIKLKNDYLYIDLDNNEDARELLNEIVNIVTSKEEEKDDIVTEETPKIPSIVISNEVGEEAKTILAKLENELKEIEELKTKVDEEKVQISEEIGKEAELILAKLEKEMNDKNNVEGTISEEVGHEAELMLKKLEETSAVLKEAVILPTVGIEAKHVLEKIENEEKVEEHQSEQEKREYDLTEFESYFHNIDGHASFKFLFPNGLGEKVVREFNVFDIIDEESLMYRIFIFKCDTLEQYETKLKSWMSMNVTSNQSIVKEEYNQIGDNGHEIKTYIFENGRFYKVAYIQNYLVAISGFESEDSLFYADLALDHVEIGEDNKEFVEATDRKNRSIKILQEQGIPYLEELPVIQTSAEVKGKTVEEIVKRAIVLCIACNFASDIISNKKRRYIKESKKFFNKLLDTYNVKDVMTKDEKLLFDKMDKNIAVQLSWQFEGYLILLWTLGLVDKVPFPDTLVEPDSVTAVVSACDTYRELLEKCRLRDVNEVLDLADLTYRYNWYCVEAKINDEDTIINPEIVMERHRALLWLLSDVKWDKVEINT